MGRNRRDPAERFWEKVQQTETCWLWTATRAGAGYGFFWDGFRKTYAHRFAYQLLVGPIHEGLEIDHLCRNRLCVNPAHMELVTRYQNVHRGQSPATHNARKIHCPRGHPYDLVRKDGSRWCRTCTREASRQTARRRDIPERSVTHCKRGHPWDEANTYWYDGKRHCKTCRHEYAVERWRRRGS